MSGHVCGQHVCDIEAECTEKASAKRARGGNGRPSSTRRCHGQEHSAVARVQVGTSLRSDHLHHGKHGGGVDATQWPRHSAPRGRGPGQRAQRRGARVIVGVVFFLCVLLQLADGWISLSDKGYTLKHSLAAQAGVKVTGPLTVNGLLISKPVAKLQCNPSRKGAIRWSEDQFEGCDGETDWRPLSFCSRSCSVNTDMVPCGLQVRNRCDKSCNQQGTGLNMRQCILNVASTPCKASVRDLCGNICGLEGQMNCQSLHQDVGKMTIKALKRHEEAAKPTSYEFGMRRTTEGTIDNGLFWTFKNDERVPQGEDMVVFQKLESFSEPSALIPPSGPNDTIPVKEKPLGTTRGMEISKPPKMENASMTISMFTELTGGYIRVGEDFKSANRSFVYLDSVIEKECPFLMSAGNNQGNLFTKVCLEPATDAPRQIVLPDASGVALTTGSQADMRSMPGLRKSAGESVLTYVGKNKDKMHVVPPDRPRVNCSTFSCQSPNLEAPSEISDCRALDYEEQRYDMYRLFYGFFEYNTSSKIFREKDISKFMRSLSTKSWTGEVKQIVGDSLQSQEMTFPEVARAFVQLQLEETGIDLGASPADWSEVHLKQFMRFGPLSTEEHCFACCCAAYVDIDRQPDPSKNQTNAEKGICPHARIRPNFCITGPKLGQQCQVAEECSGKRFGRMEDGVCGYDEDIVTCLESDQGWQCWNVIDRPDLVTRIDFEEPNAYRRLKMPAASGTLVSSGNLHDITSIGIQDSPLIALSSHNTSTTLQFERDHPTLAQKDKDIINNTLVLPNNLNEAMLLTTGNLEDVRLDSGAMTGLSIENDVYIRGSLKFDDNNLNSGLLLSPSIPSKTYTQPHSGRPASFAHPGQLSFQVHDSLTYLEFEPAQGGVQLTNITIPACSGSIVTTGNLEAITAQSGSMTSLAVDSLSHLQGGIVVGTQLVTQLYLQGHADHTMTFETKHPKSANRSQYSKSKLTFELAGLGQNLSEIKFPAVSGTVISTGNTPDVHEYKGDLTRVQREAHLRGPTFVGPKLETQMELPTDPFLLSGYVTGQIVYRESKKLDELHRPRDAYKPPFTWDVERYASCNLSRLRAGVMAPGTRVDSPKFANPRFEHDPWSVEVMSAPLEQCRRKCETNQGCGVLVASRYWKLKMLSIIDYRPTDPENSRTNYVSNAPRKVATQDGFLAEDPCYPGFSPSGVQVAQELWEDMIPESVDFDYVLNLTKYPAIRSHWTGDASCQGVIAAKKNEWAPQFGDAWTGMQDLDLQPVRCGDRLDPSAVCAEPADCQLATKECTVTIKSRVNGFYLTGYGSSLCLDQLVVDRPCAKWTELQTLWTSVPHNINNVLMDPQHPRHSDWKTLQTDTLFRFRRSGHCFDVDTAISLPNANDEKTVQITCDGDKIQNMSVWWGDVQGSCGGYTQRGSPCTNLENVLRDILFANCLGPGCTLTLRNVGTGVTLDVTSASGTTAAMQFSSADCNGKRFAAEFECKDQWYLGRAKQGVKPHFQLWDTGIDDNSLFHLHSAGVHLATSVPPEFMTQTPVSWSRECWLITSPAHDCEPEPEIGLDTHLFMRYDSMSLSFSSPSTERHISFPDTSGIVISSGNLKDITQLRGLSWKDTFMYTHLPPEELRDGNDAVAGITYVDFAAIGSGGEDRSDGNLPPTFTSPVGANRRIVFPDSSGTVITTGNVDDLLFKRLNLQGLRLDGDLTFKNAQGPKVKVRFEDSTRIAGCFNFVKERSLFAQEHYTQLCTPKVSQVNKIDLPDVSGRILTTGNLLNLPKMRLDASHMFVGGDVAIEGDMTIGNTNTVTELKAYSWIDGDVGMTFSTPNNSYSIEGDVTSVHSPHMGGVDIALRQYLTDGVEDLQVRVRESNLNGEDREQLPEFPVMGTTEINQTMCFDLLSKHRVHGMHGLGYFAHRKRLIKQTILSGTPYWGVEVPGNQTFPACVHVPSGRIICEGTVKRITNESLGKSTGTCACTGLEERMTVLWRRIGKQVIQGFRSRCPNVASNVMWDCHYDQAECNTSIFNDAGCAFDGNTSTQYRSTIQSIYVPTPLVMVQPAVMQFEAYGSNQFNHTKCELLSNGSATCVEQNMLKAPEVGRCILGLRFNTSTGVSMIRVFPASAAGKMQGGELQASSDPEGQIWVDLYTFTFEPPPDEWTDVLLPHFQHQKFVFLRYLGPACQAAEACTCDSAEWEWHRGFISQRVAAHERGVRSYFVDVEALHQDPESAMVFKCASRGWLPSMLQLDVQEVLLPEASGILLTTGNLEDITKLAGTVTSAAVSGETHIQGSSILGARGEDTEGHWHSLLTGRFPLAFAGGGNHDAATFLTMAEPAVENLIYWPPGSMGGSVLTTGMLPPMSDHISITGDSAIRGEIEMFDDVIVGNRLHSSTLRLHSSISSAFPLSFKEASRPHNNMLVFGMQEPLDSRLLMLPDSTGTVITTGNLPDVLEAMTLLGDTVFEGKVKFVQEDVFFGQPEDKINLAINAPIGGDVPLKFEGKVIDQRVLSLAVEEPSGQNILLLPDVTGTIITTGNFPDTIDSLGVFGDVDCLETVSMLGRKISIGHDELTTKLSVKSVVTGRYPLTFGHVSDANVHKEHLASSTTFEVIPPTGENVVTFPDTSGTVITSGNIPNTVMVANDYFVKVKAFVAVSSSVVFGQGAKEGVPEGSFTFADASPPMSSKQANSATKPNSFFVRATGGVKFVTGYTASNREVGAVLEANSSAWSILSDEDSKIKESVLDDLDMLERLNRLPISNWRYHGQDVNHMGPMAQDIHAIFGVGDLDRVSTLDSDGIILSALRGMTQLKDQMQDRVERLHAEIMSNEKTIEDAATEIDLKEQRLTSILERLEQLELHSAFLVPA